MKIYIAPWFLFASLLLGNFSFAQKEIKKAIIIIADGIPADLLKKTSTPNIDAIIKKGAYLDAYTGGINGAISQTPTISAPGYNNIITGTWAYKHNVWGNSIKDPNYNYPHVLRLLKEAYPHKTTAVFSSWLDNRTKLLGHGLTNAGNYSADYYFDGYELDTLHYPHDKARDFMHRIDEEVIAMADSTIRHNAPDLSWIYLEYTDDMGHAYGDSPQMNTAIGYLDEQMGKISKAIQYREKMFGEKWLLLLTTDHGRDVITGKNHGGQTERERNVWIVTNYPKINAYARTTKVAAVDIAPSVADFMGIPIPNNTAQEFDGVSLFKETAISKIQTQVIGDTLSVTWTSLQPMTELTIWLSTSNKAKTGEKDSFQKMATVKAKAEKAWIPIKDLPKGYYKISIEQNGNFVNSVLTDKK